MSKYWEIVNEAHLLGEQLSVSTTQLRVEDCYPEHDPDRDYSLDLTIVTLNEYDNTPDVSFSLTAVSCHGRECLPLCLWFDSSLIQDFFSCREAHKGKYGQEYLTMLKGHIMAVAMLRAKKYSETDKVGYLPTPSI